MMNQDNVIVKCRQCGAKNRVPRSRMQERAVCGKCRSNLSMDGAFPTRPVDVSDSSFAREVTGFPGPVFVFFWSPSCGYCRRLAPVIDELASEYGGRVKFAKLVTDYNPATASQFNVQGVPTLVLFNRGRQVDRAVGALPKHEIEGLLNRVA